MPNIDKIRVDNVDYNVVGSAESLPVGSEIDYDGSTVPDGWQEITPVYGIIESGSNANGNYIKYSDGTLIQYSLGILDVGNVAVGYTDKIITLPVSFINVSYVVMPILNSNSTAREMGNYNICPQPISDYDYSQYSTSQFKVRHFNNSGGGRGPFWSWIAIGKWK